MDNTPASLVFVAESSLAELRAYLRQLESASPKTVATLLKQIKDVCDVLSQSLDRLSHYTDVLEPSSEDDAASNDEPEVDRGLLLAALKLSDALERGFCPICGGIRRTKKQGIENEL